MKRMRAIFSVFIGGLLTTEAGFAARDMAGKLLHGSCTQRMSPDVCESVDEFLTNLTIDIPQTSDPSLVEKDGVFTLQYFSSADYMHGIVTLSSHFPYDFYLLARSEAAQKVFSVNVRFTNDNRVQLDLGGALLARFYADRFKKDSPSELAKREALTKDFEMAIGWMTMNNPYWGPDIRDGLARAEKRQTITVATMEYFLDDKGYVRVWGTEVPNLVDLAAIETLKSKMWIFAKGFARSTLSFGMMLCYQWEKEYAGPAAEAHLINKLFMKQKGDGKGEDGRITWYAETGNLPF